MKVCNNCHKENNDDSVFCSNCGKKIRNEVDIQKIVLLVGVILVLFSSVFFGILNWESMNNLFRLLFFVFETCLFFIMSLALKKVSNVASRIFFVIGLLLTPFTLSMIPYYNLIPSILFNEALIYLYLAIIYLLTFVAYILINTKFKGKILNYLALLSLLVSFIFASLIFNKNIAIIGLLITLYMFIINILSRLKFFKESSRIYYNFSLIISFFLIPLLVYSFLKQGTFEIIINSITLVLFLIDAYYKLHVYNKTILHIFAPFMFQLLSFILLNTIFGNNSMVIILTLAFVNIIFYLVSLIFKNRVFSTITLVLTYIMLGFLTLMCILLPEYLLLVLISLIFIVFNLGLLIIKKYNFVHFLITINVLTLVVGLNAWLYNFGALIIVAFLLILYLIIYLVLNLINNKYDFIYLIIMLVLGLISFILQVEEGFSVIKLIISTTFVIGYILINIFKEHISIRIIWFVILNLLLLTLFNDIYYSLLTISILTIVIGLILQKTTKFSFGPYLLYAEIVAFIVTFLNGMDHNIYSLFINVLAFILGYISLVNNHNKKPWKMAFIMVGLLYITKLLSVIIEPVVIYNLISILINLIIITALYLLDRFKSKELVIISLITLIPYYRLIVGLETEIFEYVLIPFVVYHIILIFVIKWKNITPRNVFILVPYFIIASIFILSNSGVVSTIIDSIFVVAYIIVGLFKKFNLLIYFSIGILVLTILLKIFTVLNSMAAVIALLIVGFILIFVAVIYGSKKKD